MKFSIYEVILLALFGVLIIYDLFRVIKFRKYTVIFVPVILDIILLIVICILLYMAFNIPIDYKSLEFTRMYLLQTRVKFLGVIFTFIRVVLIQKLKRE